MTIETTASPTIHRQVAVWIGLLLAGGFLMLFAEGFLSGAGLDVRKLGEQTAGWIIPKGPAQETVVAKVIPPKAKDDARRAETRAKCLRDKAASIAGEEERIATIDAGWKKCIRQASWWPLILGDAKTYCKDWGVSKLALEAGLESIKSWSC